MNPDNHTWDLLVGALKGTLGEAEQPNSTDGPPKRKTAASTTT